MEELFRKRMKKQNKGIERDITRSQQWRIEKLLFEKLNGVERGKNINPDKEESITFWNEIWGHGVRHNERSELERQVDIKVNVEDVKIQLQWRNYGCLEMVIVPEWMTKGRTCLILKVQSKGSLVSNY